VENLFVIKVINTSEAELRKWYRKKGGELYIVRHDKEIGGFKTVGNIDDEGSIGHIDGYFCEVIAEFEYDDD
jgi:hypothetical protein